MTAICEQPTGMPTPNTMTKIMKRDMKVLLTLPNMTEIELALLMQRVAEPWKENLTEEAMNNINGFLAFLQNKKLMNKHIDVKVQELERWKIVAEKVLSAPNYHNFVDFFNLNSSAQLFTVKTLYLNKISHVFVLKTAELSENCPVTTGFIITQTVREVRSKNESRDVYRATRCAFDAKARSVVKVYPKEEFFIKRISKAIDNEMFNIRLRREFKVQMLLAQVGHRGINPLAQYCEDDKNIYAIAPSAGDADLLELVQRTQNSTGETLTEDLVKELFLSAVEGLQIAHHFGIAHRDLSLENFVVNDHHLEVIDWGHAASSKEGRIASEGLVGKKRYFAPELAASCAYYDPFKADVFSLGVCLYSCLVGQMPLNNYNGPAAQALEVSATELLSLRNLEVSPVAEDLLNKCLAWNPQNRISMKEVMDHPFFERNLKY